jgi:signal transduction histidine kinase
MRVHRRTTLAAVLVGIAVLLPTAAWYVTGSREAVRRAEALEAEAELDLHLAVDREAARLGTRLEALRQQESDRPFFHYQTLYRDPRGAAQGLSVTPSPLASGRTDPFVWAHFQIDEAGEVTLPTVSERFPELSSTDDFGAFCSLLTEFQDAVVMDDGMIGGSDDGSDDREFTMTESEWEQIALADTVYATITGQHEGANGPTLTTGDLRVVIRVRPLRWHTLVLVSGPALAALREVHTPAGVVLQGFAIAPLAVEQWLAESNLALAFEPARALSPDQGTALVGGTGWMLKLASLEPTIAAAAQGRAVVNQFRSTFALTAAAVLLAAGAVIWLVYQTDRLARQRARFAAAAAHELKTPLSGLLLHSEMLAEDLGDPDHRGQYAATVASEAQRLGRVVSNMLDLSRLERGAVLASPRRGDLGSAIERTVERARRRLEGAGVAVELSIPADLPGGLFDEDALSQILDNLLDNAEKHTRAVSDRRVSIAASAWDGELRVKVSDNGPGIPRAQRLGLFRPFDRPASADATPGLGLGLALARGLARAQNGDLELATTDGPGATFVLTLPQVEF